MRFLFVIAAFLLFAAYSKLARLDNLTEVVAFILAEDAESEEENKSEKDEKKNKFDKHPYNFDCSSLLTSIENQRRYLHKSDLCLKGHCALIDQPPEA
jgi:hypothetical protein